MKLTISDLSIEIDEAVSFPADILSDNGAYSVDIDLPLSDGVRHALNIIDPLSMDGQGLSVAGVVQIGAGVYDCKVIPRRIEGGVVTVSLAVSLMPEVFGKTIAQIAVEHRITRHTFKWGDTPAIQAGSRLVYAAYNNGLTAGITLAGNVQAFGHTPSMRVGDLLQIIESATDLHFAGFDEAEPLLVTPTALRQSVLLNSVHRVGLAGNVAICDQSAVLVPSLTPHAIGGRWTARADIATVEVSWLADNQVNVGWQFFINDRIVLPIQGPTIGMGGTIVLPGMEAGDTLTILHHNQSNITRCEMTVTPTFSQLYTPDPAMADNYDPAVGNLGLPFYWQTQAGNLSLFNINWLECLTCTVGDFLQSLCLATGRFLSYNQETKTATASAMDTTTPIICQQDAISFGSDTLARKVSAKYLNDRDEVVARYNGDTLQDVTSVDVPAILPDSIGIEVQGDSFTETSWWQYRDNAIINTEGFTLSDPATAASVVEVCTFHTFKVGEVLPQRRQPIEAEIKTRDDLATLSAITTNGHYWQIIEKTLEAGVWSARLLLIN